MKSRRSNLRIPSPAHPTDRKKPLPWSRPKPALEEVAAEARLKAIMSNPSYLEADRDTAFLHKDGSRGLRLHLDYEKAERGLATHQVQKAIVVFGSTRLLEPDTARRELEETMKALSAHPQDPEAQRRVRQAEHRLELSKYYAIGRELGRLVGKAGAGPEDSRLVIMTGGGPGGMEAANRGAFDAGARTVGLNITLPHEQFPNPYITPGLCFQFHYFAMRKLHFMKRAAAIVALPGGFGTLDELFGALTLIQTRKVAPMPVILVGEEYWRKVFDVDFLRENGMIDEEDVDLYWYAETARDVWEGIQEWHRANGTELFSG